MRRQGDFLIYCVEQYKNAKNSRKPRVSENLFL